MKLSDEGSCPDRVASGRQAVRFRSGGVDRAGGRGLGRSWHPVPPWRLLGRVQWSSSAVQELMEGSDCVWSLESVALAFGSRSVSSGGVLFSLPGLAQRNH